VTPSNGFRPADPAGPPAPSRNQLRALLRARRAALPAALRASASIAISRHIAATRWLQPGRAIGLYAAVGTEPGTAALFALGRRAHCRIFLPRIIDYRQRRMLFLRAGIHPLRSNRHGIREPRAGAPALAARSLSMIFLPVLGFDLHGTRLGSGAGYYDRLLAFRRARTHGQRPLLVGLAFSVQQLAFIAPQAHDVPLDAIVTELGVIRFARAAQPPSPAP
jgi:5-formyltetrahydrofolate cyclo-ligase